MRGWRAACQRPSSWVPSPPFSPPPSPLPTRPQVSGSVKLVPKSFGCTEFILAAVVEHRAAFSLSSSGVTGPRTSAAGAVTSAVRGVAASFANSRGTVAKVDPESTSGVTGPRTSAAGAVASAVRGVLAGGAASFTTSRDTDANVDPESTTSRDAAGVILSFLAAAAPRLHEEFARYEEVDKATLEHFVEHGVEEAPESSEKEKGEDNAGKSRASEASAKRAPVRYLCRHGQRRTENRRQQPTPTTDARAERKRPSFFCASGGGGSSGRARRQQTPTTARAEWSDEAAECANNRLRRPSSRALASLARRANDLLLARSLRSRGAKTADARAGQLQPPSWALAPPPPRPARPPPPSLPLQ
jgi:hypothetical protein